MDKKRYAIRIILWLGLISSIIWLAYLRIVPSGKISYFYNFQKPSFFIGKLTPEERLEMKSGLAEIKGDPVYFSLRTPKKFNRAAITVKFKNTTAYPVMELGLLNDKIAWNYDLKPLENKVIDQLAMVWPVIYGQAGSRLIQREKKYNSIENFLNSLPPINEIAIYDYNLNNKFLLDKYAPALEPSVIDYNFRGSYQFYTYIKNETLDYTFELTDLNMNEDNDPVDIKVYSEAGLIYAKHLADDQSASPERQANIKINDLAEAVYRVSLTANDDIITKRITTRQSLFSLINKFWLFKSDNSKISLNTNSRVVSAQTTNPASLGIIKVGNSAINLNKTYTQFSVKIDNSASSLLKSSPANFNQQTSGLAEIELSNDDVIISGDGVFSFNQSIQAIISHANTPACLFKFGFIH